MTRRRLEPDRYPVPRAGTDNGPLFAHDFTPDIRVPVPVAPGSATSEAAASTVTNPIRTRSYRLIFAALAAAPRPLMREELSERTGIKESSMCARLFELRPWIEECPGMTGTASSGRQVNYYALTEAGHRRWQQANTPFAGAAQKEGER